VKLGIIAGLLAACLLVVGGPLLGQQPGSPTLLRLYEDDDYFNIRGKGTDDAYTNGSRIDFFYIPDKPSHSAVDNVLPRAGAGSIDVYGWGIMEMMFTPKNLKDTAFQPDDYPWSGALFVTHSRASYNPVRHYLLQTEVVAGVIGPASGGGALQAGFHRMIHYQVPEGWRHQFRDDLLLNLNLTLEKQLLALPSGRADHPWLELNGGTRLSGGTMNNQVSLYTLMRIGRMTPYFNGLLSQYSGPSKAQNSHKGQWQLYFTVRPQVTAVATNALLEGGVFSKKPDEDVYTTAPDHSTTKTYSPYHPLNGLVYNVDYGAVLAFRRFSISYTQDWSSALIKGLYTHEYGNFSLYFIL
jgi:lipid A 3-O-deacylase